MSEFFRVERDGPILVITIDRAEAMNALDAPRHFALSALIDEFAANPDQRVAIITGEGRRAFCAGNDLKQNLPPRAPAVPPTGFGGLTSRTDLDKPVIAAVNGLALGGGFELALACDLIVASESAFFSLPEAQVGLAPLAGGVLRLPLHIGLNRAMEALLTGRRIGAAEGHDLGFVNRVTAAGEELSVARSLAADICRSAPLSVRAIKALMRRTSQTLNQALLEQMDLPEVREMRASADAKEGPRAFAEKRAPQWRGQ